MCICDDLSNNCSNYCCYVYDCSKKINDNGNTYDAYFSFDLNINNTIESDFENTYPHEFNINMDIDHNNNDDHNHNNNDDDHNHNNNDDHSDENEMLID